MRDGGPAIGVLNDGRPAPLAVERTAVPVKWWAWAGAAYVALTVVVWARWVLSDGRIVVEGTGDEPAWRMALIRGGEAGFVLATVVLVYILLIRPWRRTGRPTTDGLLCLVFLQMYLLQDPWLNYGGNLFHFNDEFVNVGCPQCFVPGFQGTTEEAEPILFIGGMYVPILLGSCILVGKLLDAVRARRPHIGKVGLALVALGLYIGIDAVVEVPYLRLGLMSYPGSPEGLTLWSGESYAYPLWEPLFWGAAWAGFALARYFVDDAGRTVAERGIDRLTVGGGRLIAVRFLALAGLFNTIFLAYALVVLPIAIQGR